MFINSNPQLSNIKFVFRIIYHLINKELIKIVLNHIKNDQFQSEIFIKGYSETNCSPEIMFFESF